VFRRCSKAARVISTISRGISLDATEMIPTPPSAITGKVRAVVAGEHQETLRHRVSAPPRSGLCFAGFLHARDNWRPRSTSPGRRGFDVAECAARHVIEDDRACRPLRRSREVTVIGLLRRFCVVGGEAVRIGVNSGPRRHFFRFSNGLLCRIGGGAGYDRYASATTSIVTSMTRSHSSW